MIHVIATIQVAQGRREDFLVQFHKVEPAVRAEQGCLEYAPAVDVATNIGAQIPIRRDVVTVVEKWETIEALNAHLAAPHMAAYRGAVKDMVSGVQLQVLQPA
jgi:quinol monooxygenase YgiN